MIKMYRYIITAVIVICSLLTGFFFVYAVEIISENYVTQSTNNILELKKSFLKYTVDNLLREIDQERNNQSTVYRNVVADQQVLLSEFTEESESEFVKKAMDSFEKSNDADCWTVLIWNQKSGKKQYDPTDLVGPNWTGEVESVKHLFSAYRVLTHKNIRILFGVKKSFVDDRVKADIATRIRNTKFKEESYIWVNEVLNYHGGDNFAIRRIHPNLVNEEGKYLSTSMTDSRGYHLYVDELKGINRDGELFFSYYFRKLNSNVVSEKVTYAKLYKDFNWIVAMGFHQDDVQNFVTKANQKNQLIMSRLIGVLVIIFGIMLVVSFLLIMKVNKWYYRHSKKILEKEINHDELTKVYSRRHGTDELIRAYKEFKKSKVSPTIMMFDVDHFKTVNDKYGHDVGDRILKEIANAVNQSIRSSDKLIRWGGDEFVGIFHGLKDENMEHFCRKILNTASSLKIEEGHELINTTISMGVSRFLLVDQDYLDVIKRADVGLYRSKLNGRNQVTIQLVD